MSTGGNMKRLAKEYEKLTQPKEGGEGVVQEGVGMVGLPSYVTSITTPDAANFLLWEVAIMGPPGSAYENGRLTLQCKIPTEYPHKAPMLVFTPPIYHPSVSLANGEVCTQMPALANWKPTMTMRGLLEIIITMLMAPSGENVIEQDIGKLLNENPTEFRKAVQKHLKENKMLP